MLIRKLVLGTSTIALCAAPAVAQTSVSGTNRSTVNDGGGNNQVSVSNDAAGNDNNVSVVTFEGRDNRVTVAQVGDDNSWNSRHAGDANVSKSRQTGNRNAAGLLQAGSRNSSDIDQHLDPRIAVAADRTLIVEQRGNDNSSSVSQVHWNNSATVVQGTAEQAGQGNISQLLQFSAFNTARVSMLDGSVQLPNRSTVEQTRIDPVETRNVADVSIRGFGNASDVFQQGVENSSSVEQAGRTNAANARTIGNASKSAVRQIGDGNSATLIQADGDRNSSNIDQYIDPAIAIYGSRSARVEQHGADNSSIVRQFHWDNSATVVQGIAVPGGTRLLSQGNISQLVQFSAANIARVHMFDGSAEAPNKSFIEQNRVEPLVTRNLADVSIRGFGNESEVFQGGIGHVVDVSMLGGGAGTDATTQRRLGNTSRIRQHVGDAHVARVSIGSSRAGQGQGNVSAIEQRGVHHTVRHLAEIWQRGMFDTLDLYQNIRGTQDDGGSSANISQLGTLNRIALRQVGHHSAVLTQGLGRESSIGFRQYDTGGGPRAGVGDTFRLHESPFEGNNALVISQYSDRNEAGGWQEGNQNSASIWQKVGSSDNRLYVNQGMRTSILVEAPFLCMSICQSASGASATVTQDGRFNSATVNQYYAGKRATIEQLGTGSAQFRNVAAVTQTGHQNSASLLQTASVGPSAAGDPASGNSAAQNQQATGNSEAAADTYHFGGGARSTEARLLQRGNLSTAAIEQRGRGQFALIEQAGSNNLASILQDVGATNATAVIQQDGNGNSYNIVQNQPGQYVHIRQTGDNNAVTNVIQRGPGS